MDQEIAVEVEGAEEEPPRVQELLAAVNEFNKKCDPLDLSFGGRHLDEHDAAEALKAGRKLARMTRSFVVGKSIVEETSNGRG